jgi:DNA-binding NarL/FixJ family response regulator
MAGEWRSAHSWAMAEQPIPIRVFLADDSAAIRNRIAALLGAAAAVVGQARTPKGCIEGILATRPDVVVLDIQLEGGKGLEVLSAVRDAAPAIAFVVFSNNTEAAYRSLYLGAGALRFLDKSREFDQLAAAVAEAALLRLPSDPGKDRT